MGAMQINGSMYSIINLDILSLLPYRIKNLKKSRRLKFLPELLISCM
jgi:hypothetical protein